MRLIGNSHKDSIKTTARDGGFQDYVERTAKYVPVEIIAAFMALRASIPEHGTTGAIPTGAELVIYIALVALTPLYLMRVGGDVPNKRLQVAIATASFIVWSYAIGGSFFWSALGAVVGRSVLYPGLAAAVLIVWSLFAGLVDPLPKPVSG